MSEKVTFEAWAVRRDGGLIGLDYPATGPLLLELFAPVDVRVRNAYGHDARPVRVLVTVETLDTEGEAAK